MSSKLKVKLTGVPQTLMLPLYGRAKFSRTPNKFIQDQEAIRLLESIDYDFSLLEDSLSELSTLTWAIRAWRFDQALQSYLKKYPEATVVNLGAGLETAFYRNDNGRLTWIDLDLPEVIELRKKLFPENNRVKLLSQSIFDFSWIDQVKNKGKGVFFMAGGLLFYFNKEQVETIFTKLAENFNQAEIIFDGMSDRFVKQANKMVSSVNMSDALISWSLTSAKDVTVWHSDIHIVDQVPYFKGAKGMYLKSPLLFLRLLLSDMRMDAAIYHLRFGEKS